MPLAIILLMVAANALYVAAEFANVGSRKSRVQEVAEGGNGTARRLLAILRDPKRVDTYVAGCQIGMTPSSLIAGAYDQAQLTPLLEPLLGPIGGAAASIIVVLLVVTVLQVGLGMRAIAEDLPWTLSQPSSAHRRGPAIRSFPEPGTILTACCTSRSSSVPGWRHAAQPFRHQAAIAARRCIDNGHRIVGTVKEAAHACGACGR